MSRSEIESWNAGRELAVTENSETNVSERIAYETGVARAALGRGISQFLELSRADLSLMFQPRAIAALDNLGHDAWAYWVRRGYDAARAELGR